MKKLMAAALALLFPGILATAQGQAAPRTVFKVRHATVDSVYLDAGRDAGLKLGMSLTIKRKGVYDASSGVGEIKADLIVARITVVSVSNASSMCEVKTRNFEIQAGDSAYLARVEDDKPAPLWTSRAAPISQPVNALPERKSLAERVRENRGEQPDAARAATKTAVIAPAAASPPAEPAAEPAPAAASAPVSLAEAARANAKKRAQPTSATANNANTGAATAPTTPSAPAPTSAPVTASAPTTTSAPATASAPALVSAPPAARSAPVVTATPSAASTPAVTAAPAIASANVAKSTPSTAATPAVTPTPPVSSASVAKAPSAPVNKPAAAPVVEAANVVVPKPRANESPVVSARASVSTSSTGPTEPLTPGRVAFKVKYVAQDAVYIDGGKNAGLAEGMMLSIQRGAASGATSKADPQAGNSNEVAELAVVSVSSSSAVCEIRQKTVEIQRGDVAMLSQADQDKMVQARTLSPDRKYPQVIAFSEGDPLDEEARESVPKPPLPEVNRARGRIGVDYSAIRSSVAGTNSGSTSSAQGGGVVRVDMTRIGGSYWNLNGYWRGRVNLRNASSQPQTVYDLVNRTYTIGLTYANPQGRWVAGVGRLYLPWATSLDTTDGGYLARRFGSHVTMGVFGGTAPDPTSFDYNPDRQTGGTFIAFEGGSFDNVRFTSTEGVAVTGIDLREDRQFIFSENGLFFRKFLSIYHSAQADRQRLPLGGTTEGLSRSFATLRIQPFSRLSFDINHNYFRDVPTFDPLLVGTGLLDKFLFQGFSAGARLDLPGHISLYNNFGQSSKSGDTHAAFNQLYGVTIGRLWKTGIRGDVRYSQFDSSFGRGDYRAVAISRSFRELLRIEATAGKQHFISSLGTPTDYRLIGTTMDWNLGRSYFFESGFNWQKGTQQTFEQWFMTMGYRFDSGRKR